MSSDLDLVFRNMVRGAVCPSTPKKSNFTPSHSVKVSNPQLELDVSVPPPAPFLPPIEQPAQLKTAISWALCTTLQGTDGVFDSDTFTQNFMLAVCGTSPTPSKKYRDLATTS